MICLLEIYWDSRAFKILNKWNPFPYCDAEENDQQVRSGHRTCLLGLRNANIQVAGAAHAWHWRRKASNTRSSQASQCSLLWNPQVQWEIPSQNNIRSNGRRYPMSTSQGIYTLPTYTHVCKLHTHRIKNASLGDKDIITTAFKHLNR